VPAKQPTYGSRDITENKKNRQTSMKKARRFENGEKSKN
jgi:hypothetical protein